MTNYLIVALILLAGTGWSLALVLLLTRAPDRRELDHDGTRRRPTSANRFHRES